MTPAEALASGDLDALRRLLETMHDINALDEQGWTLLKWAAGRGNLDAVKLLVLKGADVFATGPDRRTPYLVALAAGRRDVVVFLRDVEEQQGGDIEGISSQQGKQRAYCRAVPRGTLSRYPGWPPAIDASATHPEEAADEIVFLHQDLSVTRSVLLGEEQIFADSSDAWATFCRDTVGFRVPDDLDLMLVDHDDATRS